jgi:hypothetical protein
MSKLSSIEELFAGRHFDREVIILCVCWYLRYTLSFRDLVEMMAERGLSLAHTTIMRRVRRYASEFVKRWNRFGRSCGRSWRVDETYAAHRAIQPMYPHYVDSSRLEPSRRHLTSLGNWRARRTPAFSVPAVNCFKILRSRATHSAPVKPSFDYSPNRTVPTLNRPNDET